MSGNFGRFSLTKTSLAIFVLALILVSTVAPNLVNNMHPAVHAKVIDPPGSDPPWSIAPSNATWGPLFGTSGDVQININRTGIAARVEIPREFLQGVISSENDTHFIQSNIRNDYYYYNVVDESAHWDYGGAPYNGPRYYDPVNGAGFNVTASDGPCFKPRFSLRDPNAPWCVEIWNYLNGTFLTFTPPKFIRFHDLNAPSVAGNYNFTLFIADHTNSAGYPSLCQNPAILPPNFCSLPDFVHAWNTTLIVPVSMHDDPATISGTACDNGFNPLCPAIVGTKGVAYAATGGQVVARAFIDETNGRFNITGLAPGTYQVLASAGFNPAYDVAYALTAYPSLVTNLGFGDHVEIGNLPLNRAPQVCGQIDYRLNDAPLAHALADHPYLPGTGLGLLNVTIEATDSQQHVYRNLTLYHNFAVDPGSDSYKLIMGSNATYVGTDPYGTEFAGLEPLSTLDVKVYVSGYLQLNLDGSQEQITAAVNQVTAGFLGDTCNRGSSAPPPVILRVGGAISGVLQFWNRVVLETPHQAELSLPVPCCTDALFGGNILIQAYDHLGILRAVSVINGTYPNATTIYRDETSIPFILLGFNEYSNRTWSGTWDEHDYGLPPDQSYSIKVYIRGYELNTSTSIGLGLGSINNNLKLKMLRGGAFQIGVFSYDNRFGTRATQALVEFHFLNLSIPVRARTYFYDSSGILVGYVECLLRLGITQPDRLCSLGIPNVPSNLLGGPTVKNSFTVLFAGQNWSPLEIWYYGDVPTHIRDDTYTIKAYTLGYVWQYGPSTSGNSLLGFAQVAVILLLGDEIEITGPIFVAFQILGNITENDHAIGEALLSGSLAGAVPANLTDRPQTSILKFQIFGFGGMTQTNGTLVGQGHFFYAGADGNRNFDYGMDNETYTALVPEFGFNRHFMLLRAPEVITFNDLFLEIGVVMSEILMATVISDPVVAGWDQSATDTFPLTWVQVTASNATYQRTVTTLDGSFAGVGALFLPQGTYNITFTLNPYYVPETQTSLPALQWGGIYVASLPPPNIALCPVGVTCP